MPSDEPPAGFDYAAYFRRIRELERLSAGADEITWREKYEPPQRAVDVLLYLGCNVLITSHLAMEVVAVFKKLGIDFEAIGGPQFCCGIVHHSHNDQAAASRLSSATVSKMESYQAKTLVMWCPSCDMQFDEVVIPTVAQDFGPTITHATEFLADRADTLPFANAVPARVAVHTHVGHPRQERDAAAALSLLAAVPGVEVAGVISSERLGYHCPTPTDAEAARVFQEERARMLEQAAAMGADTVVTLYHSCHREWCELSTEELPIRNYISLVAEALGCGAEDRFTTLRQSNDPAAVAAASRAQWTSHGWDEQRARHVTETHFPIVAKNYDTTNG